MPDWHKHLTDDEKNRLAELYARRHRLLQRKTEIAQEIAKMMNRAIRRMRRKDGKQ